MEPLFLYEQWLQGKMLEYLTISCPPRLKGRILTMKPKEYGAVLLQAYFGGINLGRIAELAGLILEQLERWRKQPEFLLAMDWSKNRFSLSFRETILLKDFTASEYHEIAAEFSLLEESLRVSTRVPLYHRLKSVGQRLLSKRKYDLQMDSYDVVVFKRLFSFFLALEFHWPSPASRKIEGDYMVLAKDAVWPKVGEISWIGSEIEHVRRSEPMAQLVEVLGRRIKDLFDCLPEEHVR